MTSPMDALVTSPEAIAYFAKHGLTVSKQAIYRWTKSPKDNARLKSKGTNEQDQPLYRLGDVLEAEMKTRNNRQSSRNPTRRLVDA